MFNYKMPIYVKNCWQFFLVVSTGGAGVRADTPTPLHGIDECNHFLYGLWSDPFFSNVEKFLVHKAYGD